MARPDEFLVREGPVDVGRVEEVDSQVDGPVDRGDRLGLVPRAVELRHPHAAQAHCRGPGPVFPKPSHFHSNSSLCIDSPGSAHHSRDSSNRRNSIVQCLFFGYSKCVDYPGAHRAESFRPAFPPWTSTPRPAIRQGFDTSLPARTQLIKSVRHRPAAPRCRRPCNALRRSVEGPSSARRQPGHGQMIDKLTPNGSVPHQDRLSQGIDMIRKKLPGG